MKFLKTLGRKSASAQASVTRGDAARDRRHWTKAASAYKAALEVNPDLPDIWVQYGHVLKEGGQISEAVDAYREALKRQSDNAETHVHLAHALKRLGRYEEAMEAFETTLGLNPSDEESAQELFSLQRRPNPSPEAAALAQEIPDMQAALRKERESSAANTLRLSALQTLYDDVQMENEALREQVAGQQAKIEKLLDLEEAHKALNERVEQQEKELKTAIAARDEALVKIDKLEDQLRDHNLRTDLARKEFSRSEGQITLMKEILLREGEL